MGRGRKARRAKQHAAESVTINGQRFTDIRDAFPIGGWGFDQMLAGGMNVINRHDDRTDGKNRPFIETSIDAAYARGLARYITTANCPGAGIVENLRNYVVGPGYRFSVGSKKHAEAPNGLVPAVQGWLDKFLEDNDFAGDLDRETHERYEVDGDVFTTLHPAPDGSACSLRQVEPEFIVDPGGEPFDNEYLREKGFSYTYERSWSQGICTPANDSQRTLGYCVQWDSSSGFDFLPEKFVVHGKANVVRNVKRGLTSFYPAWKWLLQEDRVLTNTGASAERQAAVAYVIQWAQATGDQVRSMREGQADVQRTVNGPYGSRTETRRYEQPGEVLNVAKDREYLPGPLGSERSAAFMEVVQGLLRQAGVRFCMPEYMISGDASNANFSSSVEAGTPFFNFCEARQGKMTTIFLRTIWKSLALCFERGYFRKFGLSWQQFRSIIEIDATPPNIEPRKKLEETQRRQILFADKVISRKEFQNEEEVDPEQMDSEISQDKLAQSQQPSIGAGPEGEAGLGPGGADGGKPPGGGGNGRPGSGPQKPPEAPQPGGEYSDITRQQWQRNRKAINDVLQDVAQQQIRPKLAITLLGTLGLSPEQATELVTDASDGTIDKPLPAAESFDESKVNRDHGKFSSTPGEKGEHDHHPDKLYYHGTQAKFDKFDDSHHVADNPAPKARHKLTASTPEGKMLELAEHLHGEHMRHGLSLIPIHELRDKLGLGKEEFDRAALALWRNGKINLEPISDPGLLTADQLKQSIQGNGDTRYGYIELKNPPRVSVQTPKARHLADNAHHLTVGEIKAVQAAIGGDGGKVKAVQALRDRVRVAIKAKHGNAHESLHEPESQPQPTTEEILSAILAAQLQATESGDASANDDEIEELKKLMPEGERPASPHDGPPTPITLSSKSTLESLSQEAVVRWRDYPAMETEEEPPRPYRPVTAPQPKRKKTTVKRDDKGFIIETIEEELH